MGSSSGSVSDALSSSDVSHMRRKWSVKDWRLDGTVKCVREDDAELELSLPARELGCELENEAEAAADANEDSAVGAIGSGATLLSIVSQ